MASFGGYQVGETCLIDRVQLVSALESVATGQDFHIEHRRKTRLADDLERTRPQLAGRRIPIPSPPGARDRLVADQPPGIHLQPGELRIEFSGAEDLLSKLFQLSQGILNDWGRFQPLVE